MLLKAGALPAQGCTEIYMIAAPHIHL